MEHTKLEFDNCILKSLNEGAYQSINNYPVISYLQTPSWLFMLHHGSCGRFRDPRCSSLSQGMSGAQRTLNTAPQPRSPAPPLLPPAPTSVILPRCVHIWGVLPFCSGAGDADIYPHQKFCPGTCKSSVKPLTVSRSLWARVGPSCTCFILNNLFCLLDDIHCSSSGGTHHGPVRFPPPLPFSSHSFGSLLIIHKSPSMEELGILQEAKSQKPEKKKKAL